MPRVAKKKAVRKAATKKAVRKTAAKKSVRKAPVKKAVRKAPVKKATRKTAVRKTAVRKKAVRKTAARKAPAKAAPAAKKTTAIGTPLSKAQLLNALAEGSGVSRKEVLAVMEELNSLVERHVKKRGAGQFTLPGLLKIRTVKKKATKRRKGRNPFTGEEIMIAAKPASTVVKVTPLKGLKDMV